VDIPKNWGGGAGGGVEFRQRSGCWTEGIQYGQNSSPDLDSICNTPGRLGGRMGGRVEVSSK